MGDDLERGIIPGLGSAGIVRARAEEVFEPVWSARRQLSCESFGMAMQRMPVAGGVARLCSKLPDDLVPIVELAYQLGTLTLKGYGCFGSEHSESRVGVDDAQRVAGEVVFGFLACGRHEVDGSGASVVINVCDGADVVSVVGAHVLAHREVCGVVFKSSESSEQLVMAGSLLRNSASHSK